MKGIVHRQDAMLGRGGRGGIVRRSRAKAGEFQGAFDSFRAAVGEKHAIETGPFGEFARERTLISMVIEV